MYFIGTVCWHFNTCIHINTHVQFDKFFNNMCHVCLLYCSFYALWSMSLRSRKYSHKNREENTMFKMKNVAFWVKLHSFLNLWQCVVFSVTKARVCFFTNGVFRKLFTMFFITTICVYDFCETVLVKKTHLAIVWFDFSLPKCCIFTLAFRWYCTNSLVGLETPKKKCRGRCP